MSSPYNKSSSLCILNRSSYLQFSVPVTDLPLWKSKWLAGRMRRMCVVYKELAGPGVVVATKKQTISVVRVNISFEALGVCVCMN